MKKSEQNIQALSDNYKRCNIPVISVPEGKERENGKEEMFEVLITESVLKLKADTKP